MGERLLSLAVLCTHRTAELMPYLLQIPLNVKKIGCVLTACLLDDTTYCSVLAACLLRACYSGGKITLKLFRMV